MKVLSDKKPRGTRWMKFWIYGLLPAYVILHTSLQTIGIMKVSRLYELSPYKPLLYTFMVTVLLLSVICGLHKRYPSAWWQNMIGIAIFFLSCVHAALSRNNINETWQQLINVGLIFAWTIPNIIYWRNRKDLFTCADSPCIQKTLCVIFGLSLFYIIFAFIRSALQHLFT